MCVCGGWWLTLLLLDDVLYYITTHQTNIKKRVFSPLVWITVKARKIKKIKTLKNMCFMDGFFYLFYVVIFFFIVITCDVL